jgi:LEA14-like dessication related protein
MAASGFQKPSLAFKDASLSDVTLGGATVNLIFTVTNPNDAALSLAETDYKLSLDGKQVVGGKPAAGIRIPAKGSSDITLPASVKFADLAGSIADFWRKEQANYRAEGHIGVDTPIGIAALPFEKEGVVPLPKLPDISLGTPKIGQLGLTSARIDIPLVFANQNPFALPLGSVSGALRIAGADVGEIGAQPVGRVDAKGAKTVTLPVTIRFSQAMAAARAIQEGRAHVAIDGQLAAEGAALPFHVEHDVEFTQSN